MTSDQTIPSPLTREALYNLVWSEPMLKVADRFGVSSSYMARICTLLDVPRPARGYWARLAVGRAKTKPPLPEPPQGVSTEIFVGGHEIKLPKTLPRVPTKPRKRKEKAKYVRPTHHALVEDALKHFKPGRFTHELGYIKPDKRKLIDLTVTEKTLNRALEFANELFLEFEERGHHVVLDNMGYSFHREKYELREEPSKHPDYYYDRLWGPYRCTVVYIGSVAIGLAIFETMEEVEARYVNGKYVREDEYVPSRRGYEHTWTTTRHFPTGKLRLQAYCPYWRVKWTCLWKETPKRDLLKQVKVIARTLKKEAVEIARLIEEAEHRAELERQEEERRAELRRIEEAKRRAAQAQMDSLEELKQVIDTWGEVNRIEQFFLDAESHAAKLAPDEQAHVLERLKLAREMIGSIDALDYFRHWRTPSERLDD